MPAKVLIVDDDPVIQLLLRVNFEMDGFDVATADDGEAGLALATDVLPDVVLLDVRMPKMDGYEVLEALRADPRTKDLVVVLLSGNVSAEDGQRGIDAGAAAYITKPFDPAKLLTEVKRFLPPDAGE